MDSGAFYSVEFLIDFVIFIFYISETKFVIIYPINCMEDTVCAVDTMLMMKQPER